MLKGASAGGGVSEGGAIEYFGEPGSAAGPAPVVALGAASVPEANPLGSGGSGGNGNKSSEGSSSWEGGGGTAAAAGGNGGVVGRVKAV